MIHSTALLPRSQRGRCPSLRGRKGCGRPLLAALAAILCLASCESEQKETITAPTRGGAASTAKEKPTPKTVAGSTRTSKPITGDPSKKPIPTNTKGAPKTSTAANSKTPAPQQKSAKQSTTPSPSTKKTTTDSKQASAKPDPTKPQAKPAVGLPPATYAEIAKAYNARAARLQRVWGRAVVSVDFTDDEGNHRWEQGEGHFQVIQPSRMALSAGKLSEVMLWIGCDSDRYWFIDAKEKHRAWVGKHSAASREKIESLGMPAAPRDLLALAGVTPLPKPTSDKRRDPPVRWSADKRTLIFDADRTGARWRYFINPKTYEPSRIEVLDAATGEAILSATLENYDNVSIRGDGSIPPRIATRFRCLHHPSGSTLGLSIADMTDGGAGRLRDENFDFDALHDLLGIREVIDLDAPAKGRPATAVINDADQE